MQTVLEILDKSAAYLTKQGIDTARVDAEWLLSAALGCKRLDLFLQFDRPLEGEQLNTMRATLKRRGAREPLQYILGYTDFYNVQLTCDKRALIPRPETEELVAHIIEAHVPKYFPQALKGAPLRILDIGTGTGAIGLSLAKALPGAKVLLTDISEEALALAKENAAQLGLSNAHFMRSNVYAAFENTPPTAPFNIIISNPPYLTGAELACAQPEVQAHEPTGALVPPADTEKGFETIQRIVGGAAPYLSEQPGALIALEMGIAHGPLLQNVCSKLGGLHSTLGADIHGRERFGYVTRAN